MCVSACARVCDYFKSEQAESMLGRSLGGRGLTSRSIGGQTGHQSCDRTVCRQADLLSELLTHRRSVFGNKPYSESCTASLFSLVWWSLLLLIYLDI